MRFGIGTDPSDDAWVLIEAVAAALTDTAEPPSRIARRAKVSTTEAQVALHWLVCNLMAKPVGNGAWTRYRERRFGEMFSTTL